MLLSNDLTVIIPTRNKVSQETLESIPKGVKIMIGVDSGQGQTKIRYDLAIKAQTRYLLILDDDIVISHKGMKLMFNRLTESPLSAVCACFNPIALNSFSKSILRYKQNPSSFIPTGITMWHRGHFLAANYEVPKDTPGGVGDLVLGDIIRKEGFNAIKLNYIQAKHPVKSSRKQFFKSRYNWAIDMAWYYRKYRKKGYWFLTLKMLSFPFTLSQGVFIYRLASLLGLLRGRFKYA